METKPSNAVGNSLAITQNSNTESLDTKGNDQAKAGTKEARWGRVDLAAGALLLLVLLAFYLIRIDAVHIDDDEGSYLYQAWRISEGETPYVDFLTPQQPAFLYTGSVIIRAMGRSATPLRMLSAMMVVGSGIFVLWLGAQLKAPWVGFLATLIYLLHPDIFQIGRQYRAEVYMLPLMLAGLSLFVVGRNKRERRWFVLAGALLALATLFKLFAGLCFGGCVLALGWGIWRRETRREALLDLVALAAPYGILAGGVIGGLYLSTRPVYEAVVDHQLRQGTEFGVLHVAAKGMIFLVFYILWNVPVYLFALPTALQRHDDNRVASSLAWQIPSALALLLLSRGLLSRHLVYLVPVVSLFAALALRPIMRLPRRGMLPLAIVGSIALPWLVNNTMKLQEIDADTETIVSYIQDHTEKTDLVLSDYPGLNFYAGRQSTFRGASLSAGATSSGQITGAYLIEEIQTDQVAMVILDVSPDTAHQLANLLDYELFVAFLKQEFVLADTLPRGRQLLEIYTRPTEY